MRARLALGALFAIVSASALAFGCSSEDPPSIAPDAAVADGQTADSGPDRVETDSEPPDPTPPPGLPIGWELDRSYDKTCRFYVPSSAAVLPPAVRWEPCPTSTEPPGVSCMLMAGAEDPYDPMFGAWADVGWVAPDGRVLLEVRRGSKPNFLYQIVAEADGPARAAVLTVAGGRCAIGYPDVYGDRYTMGVYEDGNSKGGGVLAGDVSKPKPTLAIHLEKNVSHLVYAGPQTLIDLTAAGFHRFAWLDGAPLGDLWSSAQDNGLQQGAPAFGRDAMFWGASTTAYHKVKAYTPANGVGELLSAGLVTDRGFGDLGTDDMNMVWIEASNRINPNGPFPLLTIMTSPFATTAPTVQQRRLRTEEGPGFGVSSFIVGCGHAARSTGKHIRIVRLADGQSWTLPSNFNSMFSWADPMALTCTELFATGFVQGAMRFIRVKLDSLGPGIAAD